MKIVLDIDGVVIDFMPSFIQVVNRLYNTNLTRNDMKDQSFMNTFGFDRNTSDSLLHMAYTLDCDPIDGAIESIDKLLGLGHDVSFLTARGKTYSDQTYDQLEGAGILSCFNKNNKSVVINFSHDKYKRKDVLSDCGVFVDDHTRHVIEVGDAFPNTRCFLLKQPWNEHCLNLGKKFKIVNNWLELMMAINFR